MAKIVNNRVENDYTLYLKSTPDKIFTLLCPERQFEWLEAWNCEIIYSISGYAEKNCVFKTHVPGNSTQSIFPILDDIWVISCYEPYKKIEFIRVNCLRTISLSYLLIDNGNNTTKVLVRVFLTGLNNEGNNSLKDSIKNFNFEIQINEVLLNHYLLTGKMLPMVEAVKMIHENFETP